MAKPLAPTAARTSPSRKVRGLVATAGLAALVGTLLVPALPASAVPADPAPASTDAWAGMPTLTYDQVEQWATELVDGDDVDRRADGTPFNTFAGFGSVSCNNTSRLLLDYKEENPEVYWRIMRLIFDPVEGAGLRHIKVELGADNNTSSGSEPATKRSADEPANVLRGAGFHFIADAKTINPDIETEVLRWGEPSWTNGDPDLRYQWYKETIDAAHDVFGIDLDYISPSQNEVHSAWIDRELAWTVDFAKRLEADAGKPDARFDYSDIKIVALDSYRNVGQVSRAILASPEALEQVDAIGYHYDIAGDPALTRLNREFGMEVIYSEGISPMIDPQYRLEAEPARGGIGGNASAVDIADRFVNAYRWSGSEPNPARMTGFFFQPAVSAMYEGTQYSPKHLIRASDPWSGYYEGGVGISIVRHFMQFIDDGWEYVEGATGGDGTNGDGGTVVDTSTRTVMTARTPQAEVDAGAELEFSQVLPNNTATTRSIEMQVANLDTDADTPLAVWQTRGPDGGEAYDAQYEQNIGKIVPVRTETIDGVERHVYRIQVPAYSIVTLSTLPQGVHGAMTDREAGGFAAPAEDTALPLPYSDDFEYAGYGTASVGGVERDYVERRGGTPRYTADQNGAFEVVEGGERGNVLEQRIHAGNRGYTWNVWGDGSQRNVSTAPPATVLGDHVWTNYSAAIDFRLDDVVRDASLPNFAGLGVRQLLPTGTDLATYSGRVHADGRWELRKLSTTVASGTIAGFDAAAWHTMEVEARENLIVLKVDDAVLGTFADTSSNPVLSGRVAILSGYWNTRYDDLRITPIEGLSWESVKIDEADARIDFSEGVRFHQSGYAHFNRTRHELPTGRSFSFEADGTGFSLFGETPRATLSVRIGDAAPRTVEVGATGARETSAWFRDLGAGPHAVAVEVTSGTYWLDGVDVVIGGGTAGSQDPETRPVRVAQPVARLTTPVGETPELPATVRAVAQAGGEIDAPVTWSVPAGRFGTAYERVQVDGVFADNPSLVVSAHVEVVPDDLRYFVDANAPADGVAYPAIAAAASAAGSALRNTAADGVYSDASGWGRVGSATAKGRLNLQPYDKTRETGWYSANASTPVEYRFRLPAGEYGVASGHTEWWNPGSGKSRQVTTTVEIPGRASTAIGAHRFQNGSAGQTVTLSGGFALDAETVVTVRVAGAGGTEAPAVSWIGIHEVLPETSIEAAATPRCLAGRVFLYTTVRNTGDAPIDVTVTSPWGSRTTTGLAPARTASAAAATRATAIDAGEVAVETVLDGRRATERVQYPALACG